MAGEIRSRNPRVDPDIFIPRALSGARVRVPDRCSTCGEPAVYRAIWDGNDYESTGACEACARAWMEKPGNKRIHLIPIDPPQDGTIEVTAEQFKHLLEGGSTAVGRMRRIITLADGPFVVLGGPGSGHHGHAGRPGEIGGSLPSGREIGEEGWYRPDEHGPDWSSDPAIISAIKAFFDSDGRVRKVPLEDFSRGFIAPDGSLYQFSARTRDDQGRAEHIAFMMDALRAAGVRTSDIWNKYGQLPWYGSFFAREIRKMGYVEALGIGHGRMNLRMNARPSKPVRETIESLWYLMDESKRTVTITTGAHDAYDPKGHGDSERNYRYGPRYETWQSGHGDEKAIERDLGIVLRGGPGSGHHGHAGRPGEVGGSAPSIDATKASAVADALASDPKIDVLGVDDIVAGTILYSWLAPDGRVMDWSGPMIHDAAARKALVAAGIVPPASSLIGYAASRSLLKMGFARLIAGSDAIMYEGRDSLTFDQAEVLARLLDTGPSKLVFWDHVDADGSTKARMTDDPDRDREELGRAVDQAYRLVGRSYDPVWRGGPGSGHHGHAGRPGEVGGSAPGTSSTSVENRPDMDTASGHVEFRRKWQDAISEADAATGRMADDGDQSVDSPYRYVVWRIASEDFMANEPPSSFIITPSGGLYQVADHDEFAAKLPIPGELRLEAQGRHLSIPTSKRTMLAMGFVRGVAYHKGYKQGVDSIDFEVEDPVGPAARRMMRDIMDFVPQDVKISLDINARRDKNGREIFGRTDVDAYLRRSELEERGGPGSGHHGHKGRPGEVGGSAPGIKTPQGGKTALGSKAEALGITFDDNVTRSGRALIDLVASRVNRETGLRFDGVSVTEDVDEALDSILEELASARQLGGYGQEQAKAYIRESLSGTHASMSTAKANPNLNVMYLNTDSISSIHEKGASTYIVAHEIGHWVDRRILSNFIFNIGGMTDPVRTMYRRAGYGINEDLGEYVADIFSAMVNHSDHIGFDGRKMPISDSMRDDMASIRQVIENHAEVTKSSKDRPTHVAFIRMGDSGGKEMIWVGDESAAEYEAEGLPVFPPAEMIERGGPGSGHHGHAGRPGEVGGSQPGGAVAVAEPEAKIPIPPSVKAEDFRGILYHGTLRDYGESISDFGVLPQIGKFVSNAYDEYEEAGIELPEYAYFASPDNIATSLTAMTAQIAIAMDKPFHEVAREDIRRNGLMLAVTPKDAEFVSFGWQQEDQTADYLEYNTDPDEGSVGWVKTDNRYSTDPGPEPYDYFTSDEVKPSQWLYGDELLKFIDAQGYMIERSMAPSVVRIFIPRGGPGSGHHGHKGRPGQVGGSAPSGRGPGWDPDPAPRDDDIAMKRGDSHMILDGPPRTARWDPIRKAMDLVDQVHAIDVPETNMPIPIKESKATSTSGQFYRYARDGFPYYIGMVMKGDEREITILSTFVHEYGHYVDTLMGVYQNDRGLVRYRMGSDTMFGSGENTPKEWAALGKAIQQSDAYKQITTFSADKDWLDSKGIEHVATYGQLRRLCKPSEFFARSYDQWIATKTGDRELAKSIAVSSDQWMGTGDGPAVQWSEEDFKPISEAMDNLFRSKGLLK